MVTQERLKELFDYEDGGFIRRSTGLRVKCSLSGNKRYFRVFFDGKPRALHRMIYIWHHGQSEGNIDHIDGNRENNKIENLRVASQQENCLNRKHHSTSKSPYKNVFWHQAVGKWTVAMSINGMRERFGYYDDIELADLVAMEARDKFHGQFARHF
jgi:hypothetical protein